MADSYFGSWDVVVAGGGTAGSAAAVAAARRGCRVLLVEEQNCLGGISTHGNIGEWFASLEGVGSIFAEVRKEMTRYGAVYDGGRLFNPEYLKLVWQHVAETAGVRVLYHASVSGAGVDHGEIRELEISSCSTRMRVEAPVFIDATGDADLAFLAGAGFRQGDPETGRTLHMSLAGWMYDTGRPIEPYLPQGVPPIRDAGELPGLGAGWYADRGRVYLDATKVMGHDPTDPVGLSDAEAEARRQLARIVHYVQRTQYPTYALAGSGAKIGIREGRRIVGEHTLTERDVLDASNRLDFPDGVAVATCQIDFHSLTEAGSAGRRQRVRPYAIPYGCLLPVGTANVLVTGRCISVDQVVHSSSRMTPTCAALGQAAGTAAALAVAAGDGAVRSVSVSQLRRHLEADGICLDPSQHRAFSPHDS